MTGMATLASVATVRAARRRAAGRLLAGPRFSPEEASLSPAIDALGGEVVRLRSRDGVRLSARWLPREAAPSAAHGPSDDPAATADQFWAADPHDAILLLHGYSGSVAPDLVEYGPFLRRTAGVLGLDFRGHGDSEDGPSTFGLLEVEDVAGALAWLGERGITQVALVGSSMGGITAIAAVAVLGDGSLAAADAEPDAADGFVPAPRPRIVAVVADSVAPEIVTAIAGRLRGPARRFAATRLIEGAASVLGADPRSTEPGRVIGLVEPVPLLLIHGEADSTVPIADGLRLAAMAGPSAQHWVVPGAEHSGAHAAAGPAYEGRVARFLRSAFVATRHAEAERDADRAADERGAHDMMARPEFPAGHPPDQAMPAED